MKEICADKSLLMAKHGCALMCYNVRFVAYFCEIICRQRLIEFLII